MDLNFLQIRQNDGPPTMEQTSAPYAPTTASLGGHPTVIPDVPICACFLVLFIMGAIANMTILKINQKHGHKFVMSGMSFGLCMARITAMTLRIVWANRPTNVRVAIASEIFTFAGVILLFIINLIFSQRIFRALHPSAGWHRATHRFYIIVIGLIPVSLVMLIVAIIQSFYTLDENVRRNDRDVLLYGSTYFMFASFLPLPITTLALLLPRKAPVEKFGAGRFRNKVYVLYFVSFICFVGAAFRTGTSYPNPPPAKHSPAYFSKACFYIFNFTIEITVIATYIFMRVDRRFWVPNKSNGPGSYSSQKVGRTAFDGGPKVDVEKVIDQSEDEAIGGHPIAPEEELFDNMSPEELAEKDAAHKASKRSSRRSSLEPRASGHV